MTGRVRQLVFGSVLAVLLIVPSSGAATGQELRLDDTLLPRLHAQERVELGALDDPVLAFSRIADLAIGPDGNLYVVQSQKSEVTVLDREGGLVRLIVQRGQGPGEFLSPAAIGWFADTLWVLDAAQRRITRFVEDRVVGTHSLARMPPELGRGTYPAAQLPLRWHRSSTCT